MAPRLSRWIALTLVSAGIVATITLTAGGTPLMYMGLYRPVDADVSASQQIFNISQALDWTREQLATLETREQLAAILSGTSADPLVLRVAGRRLAVDAPATAAAESLWRSIPGRRDEIRTVIVLDDPRSPWGIPTARLDTSRVCIFRSNVSRSRSEIVTDLRRGGGDCLFAEQFGTPGGGVRTWRTKAGPDLSWDRGERRRYWYRWREAPAEWTVPAWFQRGSGPGYLEFDFEWREVGRLEMACLGGRPESCEAASGVGEAGWPREDIWRGGYNPLLFPQSRLPRDLLQAVGPQKFGAIWTSDDPMAVSYARATGEPMGSWLMAWAQRHLGTIRRDNGLSLVGWLGAFLWIGLFALLTMERIKQRVIG